MNKSAIIIATTFCFISLLANASNQSDVLDAQKKLTAIMSDSSLSQNEKKLAIQQLTDSYRKKIDDQIKNNILKERVGNGSKESIPENDNRAPINQRLARTEIPVSSKKLPPINPRGDAQLFELDIITTTGKNDCDDPVGEEEKETYFAIVVDEKSVYGFIDEQCFIGSVRNNKYIWHNLKMKDTVRKTVFLANVDITSNIELEIKGRGTVKGSSSWTYDVTTTYQGKDTLRIKKGQQTGQMSCRGKDEISGERSKSMWGEKMPLNDLLSSIRSEEGFSEEDTDLSKCQDNRI